MRRIIIRFAIIAVFLGGGWLVYQVSDYTKCSGPRAEEWVRTTGIRLEESNRDFESVSPSSSISIFSRLESRANSRYKEQQNQDTPSCLSGLHQQTLELFYNEWRAYEAAAKGDLDFAATYMNKSADAQDRMWIEFDNIAIKYGWDVDH